MEEKESIGLKDIVSYNDGEYFVEFVWNHGIGSVWYDLKATTPAIEGVNYIREEKSVPSYECKLIKKHQK